MRVHHVHIRLIAAAMILLAFSSVSEARWLRGGHGYYYVPSYSAGCAHNEPGVVGAGCRCSGGFFGGDGLSGEQDPGPGRATAAGTSVYD